MKTWNNLIKAKTISFGARAANAVHSKLVPY